MNTYVIAFGANMGDASATLHAAYAELATTWHCRAASHLYRSAPVGGVEQADFTNAVAVFDTDLTPHQVLDELHRVENQFGRTRDVRWGPRTLDLDMITAWTDGEPVIVETPDLTLPHPRAFERSFVTVPWTDLNVAPEWQHLPGHGEISTLPSTQEELVRLPERLDT